MQFVPENNVYVYFRYSDFEQVMVVINNNPEQQTIDLKRFKERIKTTKTGTEIISENPIALNSTLTIEGKTSMIIEF